VFLFYFVFSAIANAIFAYHQTVRGVPLGGTRTTGWESLILNKEVLRRSGDRWRCNIKVHFKLVRCKDVNGIHEAMVYLCKLSNEFLVPQWQGNFLTSWETVSFPHYLFSLQLMGIGNGFTSGSSDRTQTHFHQEKTTRPYPHKNALAARTKVPTLHHQQTTTL
jgi:hypothetical protein